MIETLKGRISLEIDPSMSDDEFIANVDDINQLCCIYDELEMDRSAVRERMTGLYPEFARRIGEKGNIQEGVELIKALYRFIYGRSVSRADRGPEEWRNAFVEYCRQCVEQYRLKPLMHSADYLYTLVSGVRVSRGDYREVRDEYQAMLREYLRDLDSCSEEEKRRRVAACYDVLDLFPVEDFPKWKEAGVGV